MSARLTSRDRLARLLSIIPWIAEADDGRLIDDVVVRFDYPRRQLISDLQDVVFYVGVYPFTPDSMIEVDIRDERVRIHYADWFSRPLRLAPNEIARLLTAGRSALPLAEAPHHETDGDTSDADAASPLLRALTKLGTALGDAADSALDVRLGDAPSTTLELLRGALATGNQVELDYYAYGRDQLSSRTVDPQRLFSDNGNWYLGAWCHRAGGPRVFRVDRIREATVGAKMATPASSTTDGAFSPAGDDPRVTLRIPDHQRWVTEQYPNEGVVAVDSGYEVRMAVTALPWLERLLLRLGPDVELRDADTPVTPDLGAAAAARILQRYQSEDSV